jgi:hypothetical protein
MNTSSLAFVRFVALVSLASGACSDEGGTTTAPDAWTGGSDTASSGGGSGGSSDDPCDVAGEWTTGCGSVTLCGLCEGASQNLDVTFTIPADVAKSGGTFAVGAATLEFDVATCTLTTQTRFCEPWNDDVYTLEAGVGTGKAWGHCRGAANTCDCAVEATCSPRRLD